MSKKYINRLISKRLKKLFKTFPSIVITGARQVGKSTLLKHLFPEIPIVVFDPIHDVQGARADPELFLNNHPTPLILDEVQFAPELIPVIKRRIDQNKNPGQYILTGSQQWGVLKHVSESLAGRAILLQLEGFSITEIAKTQPEEPWLKRWLDDPEKLLASKPKRLDLPYTLVELLWRGFLPETRFLDLDVIPDFQFSYQSTYIEKDVRLLADIENLQTFSRFVKLTAALVAKEINYSKLGRDIGITPQTAKRWIDLLIQTFEWFEVSAFSNNAIKKISSKPKGYFSDTGQICFSQMISSPQALINHPLWGHIFENAVVSELRKQNLLMSTPAQFYQYRTHSGSEVDLILERNGKFYPIEIKSKSRPTKKDAAGITAFRKAHPKLNIEKGLIIAPAEEIYPVTENDYVIPWDLF